MANGTQDSRPRATYLLPDGTEVQIIFDHGEARPAQVTYELSSGRVVYATRKTPPVNPYEDEGRAVKVQKLSEAIDSMARSLGLDSSTPAFADMLERGRPHPQVWWNLARTAGVRPPSDRTIAQIIAVYRERAARSQRSAFAVVASVQP